ncbi:MAG TPA: F0F1 ATP synthase subunit epsilon [Nevskiaceae bacterium]|nr:F0F1 ATP synthase subunit epsilon [Nevskiaceae bacterium]
MAVRTEASTGEVVEVPGAAAPKPDKHAKPTMHIKVYSPFKIYFDQAGYSISGKNQTGPFDILPHHHNFMTLLTPGELIIRRPDAADQKIRISGGLMHVKADRATVFLDI